MTEEDKENKYQKFFQSFDDKKNQNSSNSSNSQNSTSESSDGDVISEHNKEPQKAKSFVPEILTAINEHTTLSEGHQILKKYCDKTLSDQEYNIKKTLIPTIITSYELSGKKQAKSSKEKKNMFITQNQKKQDKNYLGKKRSHPDTSDYELEMEKAIKNALFDTTQFLNEISTKVYKNNELHLIIREDFCYHNKYLNKSIQEILLEENIGHQKKESIEYKIKCLLELEQEKNHIFLPFCEDIFKMKLKDLLLVYINDRKCSLSTIDGKIQLKTLEDNQNFTDTEKEKLKEQISKYLKAQIKHTNGKLKIKDLKNPTIKNCFNFLIEMINKILEDTNIQIEYFSINKYINQNSTAQFLPFFNRKIGDILKIEKKNKECIESIMNKKDTSKEIEFLKWLLQTKFIEVVKIFINDKSFSSIYSNKLEVEFKTLKDVKDGRIQYKKENIVKSMNKILEKDEENEKENKINDC